MSTISFGENGRLIALKEVLTEIDFLLSCRPSMLLSLFIMDFI